MKAIELTRGMVAVVDDDDFDRLAQYNWRYSGRKRGGHAARVVYINGKQASILMHREIMNPPSDLEIDHINGNGIDNRKQNLRVATHAQNLRNQTVRSTNKLGVKGVCLTRQKDKYRATITTNGKQKQIGVFNTVEEAKAAYDKAAPLYHGAFASVNGQREKELQECSTWNFSELITSKKQPNRIGMKWVRKVHVPSQKRFSQIAQGLSEAAAK